MFKLNSNFKPCGDQPKAIENLVNGLNSGDVHQTLLGVTGSGKTFTIANVIEKIQKPTLVIAHNKTLAAQLCNEFREFFPDNLVEYFVSYYDYFQPEAYIASTDTYIEKDSSINEEIDRLRHSATSGLMERRDVIIVASVSCIYGLGDPEDYNNMMLSLRPGMKKDRDEVIESLVKMQYTRNDIDFKRSTFRVRGDILEIYTSESRERILRIEFFGDEIERISEIDWLTGEIFGIRTYINVYPASHYVTSQDKMNASISEIERELAERIDELKDEGKVLEAYRLEQRTLYDIEMLKEIGFCSGIENYSRIISGRKPGSPPYTLIDFFPDDFLIVVDESHVTIPQIGAMYNGDRARKKSLIDYGFRLPSAYDNRPLMFNEFEEKVNQIIYVSATPAKYEKFHSTNIVEQIIRPTGLIDPNIIIKPVKNQIDDLINEIKIRVDKNQKILVTTLTKRMAEKLTEYLFELNYKVKYLHSEVKTMERSEIIRELRSGELDIIVGINLLREGLDIPEVTLVAILDADKEGFLRSETSLIQTIGRAARNIDGTVIMYADTITESIKKAISETDRRRDIQNKYNIENNITPESVTKAVYDSIKTTFVEVSDEEKKNKNKVDSTTLLNNLGFIKDGDDVIIKIEKLTAQMLKAAQKLKFEEAAAIRDEIQKLRDG